MVSGEPTVADAVRDAAHRAGITVTRAQAAALAVAALTHADTRYSVTRAAWREMWSDERYRAHVRAQMERELHRGLVEHEMLPVTLPAEKITYLDRCQAAVGEDGPWCQVMIALSVPARTARGHTA